MQNRTFLVLLRPIFCEKLKIAPHRKTAPRIRPKNLSKFRWRPFFFFLETTWYWAEKTFEFRISAEKSVSIRWRPFFLFFGDHLSLGGKNLWISELSEKFRLNFRTNRVKLIQEQWKFGSRSIALFSLFQNSPPFSKSWLRACLSTYYLIKVQSSFEIWAAVLTALWLRAFASNHS